MKHLGEYPLLIEDTTLNQLTVKESNPIILYNLHIKAKNEFSSIFSSYLQKVSSLISTGTSPK